MGVGGIGIWQLLIILVIVLLLFGTKRLRNLGGDLGSAIKGFKGAMSDGEKEKDKEAEKLEQQPQEKVAEDKAADQAKEAKHSLEKEIKILLVHSLGHLLGYDHDYPEKEKSMLNFLEKYTG